MRYGGHATYTGRSAFMSDVVDASAAHRDLRSPTRCGGTPSYDGVEPSPVAVTSWSQPWVRSGSSGRSRSPRPTTLPAWTLGQIDLEPPETVTPTGRVLSAHRPVCVLTAGVADDDGGRDHRLAGQPRRRATWPVPANSTRRTRTRWPSLRGQLDTFDVVSATLDGWRDQLLGVPVPRRPHDQARARRLHPRAAAARASCGSTRARLVDAFGQVARPARRDAPGLPARDEIDRSVTGACACGRDSTVPARWLFRFVDPAGPAADAAEARARPGRSRRRPSTRSPGSCCPTTSTRRSRCSTSPGTPLGQLLHEPFGGGVTWEPAPGRPLPADAGPLDGLDRAAADRGPPRGRRGRGRCRAARRTARATRDRVAPRRRCCARSTRRCGPWTRTPASATSTSSASSGGPIAVVRARLSLDIKSDIDDLDLSDPTKLAAREQAYHELAALDVPACGSAS